MFVSNCHEELFPDGIDQFHIRKKMDNGFSRLITKNTIRSSLRFILNKNN